MVLELEYAPESRERERQIGSETYVRNDHLLII